MGDHPHAVARIWDKMYRLAIHGRKGETMMAISAVDLLPIDNGIKLLYPDGSFTMLGKTFKGMTDKMLAWQTEALQARSLGQEGHVVHVKPELVVEIACNDIQASPHYPGGLALRFARVKRYREDKAPEDADTIETVRQLFEKSAALKRK